MESRTDLQWILAYIYSPHLFGDTIVVDLQCVLLLVVVRGNNHPNHHNNLTYETRQTLKQENNQ